MTAVSEFQTSDEDAADPRSTAVPRVLRDAPPSRTAEKRGVFFDRAEAHSEYLCAKLPDGRLLVKTEDHHVGRALFVKGGRGDIKVLHRCVMTLRGIFGEEAVAGRTFIDVGANIGSTTVSALVANPFSGSLSLEPEPENFLTLKLNLVLNRIEHRAVARQLAASNVTGELDLVVNRARSGRHWLSSEDIAPDAMGDDVQVAKVPVVTLDSLADAGEFDPAATGLLWIDAENHEPQILEGASQLTALGVPVLFEWDPHGLAERGDADKLYSIVEDRYTHYAKMRADAREGQPRYQLHPAAELRDLAETDDHFTDILILRLTEEQVPAGGLAAMLRALGEIESDRPVKTAEPAKAAKPIKAKPTPLPIKPARR